MSSEEGNHAIIQILLRLDAEHEINVTILRQNDHLWRAPELLDGADHIHRIRQSVVASGRHPQRERARDDGQVVNRRRQAEIVLQVAQDAVVVLGESPSPDHLRQVSQILQRGGVRLELQVVGDACAVEAAVGARDGG